MLLQLVLGSLVISVTVITTVVFIGAVIRFLTYIGPWLVSPFKVYKVILSLVGVTLWLMAALTASVWIWAAAYIALGVFESLEPALYFSVVAFTTLGFGDVTLPVQWRLLSGMCAANGLLLFGLNTAFLVEFFRRMHHAGLENGPNA